MYKLLIMLVLATNFVLSVETGRPTKAAAPRSVKSGRAAEKADNGGGPTCTITFDGRIVCV